MRKVQRDWFASAPGRAMDPDGAYNLTCKDVVDDYAQSIFPGVTWATSVRGANANQVLDRINPEYWTVFRAPIRPDWKPLPGDIVVYAGEGLGHVFVIDQLNGDTISGIEQNGYGNSRVPAARVTRGWYAPGAGNIIGWARPKAEKMPADPAPAAKPAPSGYTIKRVSVPVATVRTSPYVRHDNIAGAFPHGIAKGAEVACVGYVQGQDPYPNDRVQDDAWVKTKSGFFIWANNLGNDLSGLRKV